MIELVIDNSVRDECLTWPDRARALLVTDDGSCVKAAELLKAIKALRQRVAETFDPHIKRANDAHKALCQEKREAEQPLAVAEELLKGQLLSYEQAQERVRRERERELQEQARREEESRRLDDAAALEREAAASNDPSLLYEAEALLEQPILAPVVTLPSLTPKVAGIAYRETWKADPTVDLKALARAVADGLVPTTYLLPNLPALNQIARATKGTQPVPGVRFVRERTVAAGVR